MKAGKRVTAEDDIVVVYQGKKEVYSGLEDYNPYKGEGWRWVQTTKDGRGHYELKTEKYGVFTEYRIH
jgi:hypothetical protein